MSVVIFLLGIVAGIGLIVAGGVFAALYAARRVIGRWEW